MNPFHTSIEQAFHHSGLDALALPSQLANAQEHLPAWFKLSELASASVATACSALCRLHTSRGNPVTHYQLDQRLCNLWFGFSLSPLEFEMPSPWDSIAGDYPTKDGWIRLHTNAPHHKLAALKVLKCQDDRLAVSRAVTQWFSEELESAIVAESGCAAKMNTLAQWREHPQGIALSQSPLIEWQHHKTNSAIATQHQLTPCAPLAGLKILDLTRVLAGPIATRFLAGFGAQVLRLDPESWDEPSIIPEVTLGKRCAPIDLKSESGKKQFIELLKSADVLVHGYRADALDKLGFGPENLAAINPNLISASLNAYGWQGPWVNRRGFDSLMQMSTGIADHAMQQTAADRPVPLPVQGLDHATGYFLAACVIQSIELRETLNIISRVRCSLASTAHLLIDKGFSQADSTPPPAGDTDYSDHLEETSWGLAKRLQFPASFEAFSPSWPQGAQALRTSSARWQ